VAELARLRLEGRGIPGQRLDAEMVELLQGLAVSASRSAKPRSAISLPEPSAASSRAMRFTSSMRA
jgi:hypothetical protein